MRFMLGVDEAGRGPLAGPVAVGLVRVPEHFDVAKEFPGVRDSKKLSEKKREKIFEMLKARVAQGDAGFVVEFESAQVIDKEGIAMAVRRALERGLNTLTQTHTSQTYANSHKSDLCILLDGSLKAPPEYRQQTIIHGDDLIPIISLASIAAKVSRDHLMLQFAGKYPEYAFEKHKGYGTALHYELLALHGPSPLHRRSYLHI